MLPVCHKLDQEDLMGKVEEINFVEQVQHYFCKSVQDRKLEVAIKETLFGGARQTDITTGQTDTHQKVIATRPTDRQTGCHASVSWPPVCCRSPQSKQECRCLIICVALNIAHPESQTAFSFRKQEYLDLGRMLFSKISSVYLSVYLVLQSQTLTLFLKWKLNLYRCQNIAFSKMKITSNYIHSLQCRNFPFFLNLKLCTSSK